MQELKDATIEIKDAAMANTKAIVRLERKLGHLVAEFNRIEEEELQTQEMMRGQYMIDEDGPSNSYHEHVQATTFGSEEVVNEIVNESSLKDLLEACLAQFGEYLDLDKLLEQADAILDPTPEVRTKNEETIEISFPKSSLLEAEPFIVDNHKEEEKEEQVEKIEPPPIPNLSNDKEVNTETHSFVTIPLETQLEP
jgi:curved DNA-binding protein CbpA